MLSAAVQILAFGLALLGVLGSTVATLLPNWKVAVSVWSSALTPVLHMQGLWMDCVWYTSGVFSCTLKDSLLALPASLHMMRAAMVLCCTLAAFGLCLASLGLKCTRWGGSRRAKGHTAVAAGACLVLASLLCLVPASCFTSELITAFLTSDLPDSSKYQPGGALCVTFLSAGFLLAGGVIFCLSCPGKQASRSDCPASPDPDRFQLQADQRWRQPQHKHRKHKSVKLQTDEVKQDGAARTPGPPLHPSPSRPPHKDVKDSYSLQEYV